jgi:hypothetical protein
MISNNGPQAIVNRTGSRGVWAWVCGHALPGEFVTRCPSIGKPYQAERRVEFYGKTRLQAVKAYEAATGWSVN